MDTSHPPSAPSAANLENVLSGIQYPKTKQGLMEFVSQKRSTVGEDLFDLARVASLTSVHFLDRLL